MVCLQRLLSRRVKRPRHHVVCAFQDNPPTQTTTTQKSEVITSVSHPPHPESDGNAAFQPLTRDLAFTSQAGFLSSIFLLTLPTPSVHSG